MYQVLVSIQGLIMNSEPIYNEPGYAHMQGTPEGNDKSAEYNARLHPYTVRYAMLDQLRNPPRGFDDVVLEHFQCQKDVILKQCSQWLKDSPTPQLKKKLQRAVAELQEEFDKI
jgi:baculoviral IAP repeat-containing protein 6